MKIFEGNNLHHELLLTTRQKIKLRNTFENNMSTDIKLSKSQISKIIQSGRCLGSLLSKIVGPLMILAVLLAKNTLDPLRIKLLLQQLIQEFKRKYMILEQQN